MTANNIVIKMNSVPELKRLLITGLNCNVQVQTLSLKKNKIPNQLIFEHASDIEVLCQIDQSSLIEALNAYIYEIPSQDTLSSFGQIESLLKTQNNDFGLGILHEPINNYRNIYVILRREHSESFGFTLKGAKFALFKLSYKIMFNNNTEKFIKYLAELCRFTDHLIRINRNEEIEKTQINAEIRNLNNKILMTTEKNKEIQRKIVTARKSIKKLFKETQVQNEGHSLDCVECKMNKKEILLLPCGDFLYCKICMMSNQKIPFNVRLKKLMFKCPKCKKLIEEAKEVFIE